MRGDSPSSFSARQNRPIADTVSKNALNRFQTALHKSFDERLDGLDEGARAAVEQSDDVKAIKAWVRKVEREESDESESAEEEDDDDDDAESEEGEEEESDASEEETEV